MGGMVVIGVVLTMTAIAIATTLHITSIIPITLTLIIHTLPTLHTLTIINQSQSMFILIQDSGDGELTTLGIDGNGTGEGRQETEGDED